MINDKQIDLHHLAIFITVKLRLLRIKTICPRYINFIGFN